LKILGNFTWFL